MKFRSIKFDENKLAIIELLHAHRLKDGQMRFIRHSAGLQALLKFLLSLCKRVQDMCQTHISGFVSSVTLRARAPVCLSECVRVCVCVLNT
jgi:hypothetical protein